MNRVTPYGSRVSSRGRFVRKSRSTETDILSPQLPREVPFHAAAPALEAIGGRSLPLLHQLG